MSNKYGIIGEGSTWNMKYRFTDKSINVGNHTLYMIRALRSFGDVKAGDLGGYIESEDNLSHEGDCWVFGDDRTSMYAQVSGTARVWGDAQVSGTASIHGHAQVYGRARVSGCTWVYGNARICGDAYVNGLYHTINIRGHMGLDHGVWTHRIIVDDKPYQFSRKTPSFRSGI